MDAVSCLPTPTIQTRDALTATLSVFLKGASNDRTDETVRALSHGSCRSSVEAALPTSAGRLSLRIWSKRPRGYLTGASAGRLTFVGLTGDWFQGGEA